MHLAIENGGVAGTTTNCEVIVTGWSEEDPRMCSFAYRNAGWVDLADPGAAPFDSCALASILLG